MSPTQRFVDASGSQASSRRGPSTRPSCSFQSPDSSSEEYSDDDSQSRSQPASQRKKALTNKSRLSQSQSLGNITEETLERLSNECVRLILLKDQKKHPVKRPDIMKSVLKDHGRAYKEVLTRAQKKLKQVFGFKMVELSKKGSYIIINEQEWKPEYFNSGSAAQSGKQGLLLIVLTAIYMSGNTMHEDQLWKMLKKFGIFPSEEHDLLGDVKKMLVQEFVRQLYLEYKPIPGIEPAANAFSWGQRAQLEVSKKMLLEFVCEIYGDGRKPEEWISQYQDASEQSATVM